MTARLVIKRYSPANVSAARGTFPIGSSRYIELDFVAADLISPLVIGQAPVQSKIFKIRFDVIAPFDNDTSFSIGTDSIPTLLFSLSKEDAGVAEGYDASLNESLVGNIKVFPNYIVLPTTGSATITVFTT